MDNEDLIDGLENQVVSHPVENTETDEFLDNTGEEASKMNDLTWLSDNQFEETEKHPFDTSGLSDDNRSVSNGSNENMEVENSQNNMNGSEISFTGYGRCECGCGSFGGCGNICTYCGHPYSAHSRYKK